MYIAGRELHPGGKAVLDVEYNGARLREANAAHLNAQQRDLDLVGAGASGYKYSPCIPDSQTAW